MTNSIVPSGFLVLNKVANFTSHQCVAAVRKTYQLKRVGHGGTLDPDVTGILTIAIGSATRLLPYLPSKKSYTGEIQLGQYTTTDDLRGEIISSQQVSQFSEVDITERLNSFIGVIEQQPPQISAVHVNGERSYIRARRGEKIMAPTRKIIIYSISLEHWESNTGRLRFQISCSSGTYIRSIARDLGQKLRCGGCLAWLQRTESQGFPLSVALPLSALNQENQPKLIKPIQALKHLSSYQLLKEELNEWQVGRPFTYNASQIVYKDQSFTEHNNDILNLKIKSRFILILSDNNAVDIGIITGNRIHPKVVLNSLV